MTSHSDLVERAVRWLKNSAQYPTPGSYHPFQKVSCSVVFSEIVTCTSETPDAIGWCHSGDISILIECKTTLSDFYSDRHKLFRKEPYMGVGDYRYYLTPKGMVKETMTLPDGWGLLEIFGKQIRVIRAPSKMVKNKKSETNMLWSAVRRLNTKNDRYCKPVR